jgi:hypothetical protein
VEEYTSIKVAVHLYAITSQAITVIGCGREQLDTKIVAVSVPVFWPCTSQFLEDVGVMS